MQFSIITLFPEMFEGILNTSMLKRAQESGNITINIVNLRDFGLGTHKMVDDRPYGGGKGMILRVDVLHKAIESVKKGENEIIVLLDPKGEPFTQSKAQNLSKANHIVLICGHYEGYDERIREFIDMEVSLGDFVLTGGEIPAMVIVDAVTRLVEGAILDKETTDEESFSEHKEGLLLEYPHYTRPAEYNGQKVPEELLTGDPKITHSFRHKKSLELTKKRRPDLLRR